MDQQVPLSIRSCFKCGKFNYADILFIKGKIYSFFLSFFLVSLVEKKLIDRALHFPPHVCLWLLLIQRLSESAYAMLVLSMSKLKVIEEVLYAGCPHLPKKNQSAFL